MVECALLGDRKWVLVGKKITPASIRFLQCTGTLLSFGVLLVYYLTNEGRFFHAVRVLFYCSDLVVSRGLGENEKE